MPPSSADVAPKWPPGLVGPSVRPTLSRGDHHLIANDQTQTLTAFTHDGRKLWAIPCICRGQGGDAQWTERKTDTPPSLYRVERVFRDYDELGPWPTTVPDELAPYGWYFLEIVDQLGRAQRLGRDGFGIHGGGSALGRRGSWAPMQSLLPSYGCCRVHNAHLRDYLIPLLRTGSLWVSVLQESV